MNYDRELNKGMKVFSQLYVGLQYQKPGQIDLGFATPLENNAAFRKRKETVDNWATVTQYEMTEDGLTYKRDAKGGYIMKAPVLRSKVIDNTPREGFLITDDVKRVYYGGGNVVWRIADPSGFELEIQSQNLMAIIQSASIEAGGKIAGKCVWGRSGKDNILLHETSEEYQNAFLAAETLKKPKEVPSAEREVGMEYLMQNGDTGIYLGKFWVSSEKSEKTENYVGIIGSSNPETPFRSGVWRNDHVVGEAVQYDAVMSGKFDSGKNQHVTLYKRAPFVRLIEGTTSVCTLEQAEKRIQDLLVTDGGSISWAAGGRYSIVPVHIAIEKPNKIKYVTKPLSKNDFKTRIARIKESGRWHFRHNTCEQPINAAEIHFFSSNRHSRIGVQTSDGLFSEACHVNSYNYSGKNRSYSVLSQAVLHLNTLATYENEQYRSWGVGYTEANAQNVIKTFEAPKFSSMQAIIDWVTELFEAGKLVTIFAVEDKDTE